MKAKKAKRYFIFISDHYAYLLPGLSICPRHSDILQMIPLFADPIFR